MSPSDAMLTSGVGRRRPERRVLPEISRFFGIVVFFNSNDHPPPHFHARYAGRRIAIDIRTLRVLSGRVHPRALGLLIEWASLHRDELMAGWDAVRRDERPAKIPPLG